MIHPEICGLKVESESERIQRLLNGRQIGERGAFMTGEPCGHSVKVQEGPQGKEVVIDAPFNHEIDGAHLNSEQIQQVDWNNDRQSN